MRGEMNSNRYEISFRLKISLRCSVSSLLVFTWIEAKWNSKRYGFHIGHFDRNEISFRVIKYVSTTRNERPTTSIKISSRFEMQPKWNFMWTELVFTPVWNLKPVWVHFVSKYGSHSKWLAAHLSFYQLLFIDFARWQTN